jgi:hypothetical protein
MICIFFLKNDIFDFQFLLKKNELYMLIDFLIKKMNNNFEIVHLLSSIEKYKSKKSIRDIIIRKNGMKNKKLIKMYLKLCDMYYKDFQYNNVIRYSLKSLRICEKYYNNFFTLKSF